MDTKLFKSLEEKYKTTIIKKKIITLETFIVDNVIFNKKQYFDLTTNTQITGKNGTGKSSIFKLITHCIKGPKNRGKTLLYNPKKTGELELTFKINNITHKVTRILTPNKNDTLLFLKINNNKKTSLDVNTLVKLFEQFFIINHIDSIDRHLINMTPIKLKVLLMELGNKLYLQDLFKHVKEHVHYLEMTLESKQCELNTSFCNELKEETEQKLKKIKLDNEYYFQLENVFDINIRRLESVKFLYQNKNNDTEYDMEKFKLFLLNKNDEIFNSQFLKLFFNVDDFNNESEQEYVLEKIKKFKKLHAEFKIRLEKTNQDIITIENQKLTTQHHIQLLESDIKKINIQLQEYLKIKNSEKEILLIILDKFLIKLNKLLGKHIPTLCISKQYTLNFNNRSINFASHYEQNISEILLHAVIHDISHTQFNFIFVDEPFDVFDTSKYNEIKEYINILKETFKSVFGISHHYTLFENNIILEK
jgi:hypothetical protein